MAEGLIDMVVPATHNHEPDSLDWPFDRFVKAAKRSPRRCLVAPQIWPTGASWGGGDNVRHSAKAVLRRAQEIVEAGADGAYFFNFMPDNWTNDRGKRVRESEIFRNIGRQIGEG